MLRSFLAAVLVVGLSLQAPGCGALRPASPNRTLRVPVKGSFFKTTNGYMFSVLEDSSARLVRLDVRYPVGWADDPKGKEGLAHLVEHLPFEFDIERDGRTTSISDEFGRLSTYSNAMTDADYMHFESQGLPEVLPELMRLEAERASLGCSQIQPEIFERRVARAALPGPCVARAAARCQGRVARAARCQGRAPIARAVLLGHKLT